MELDMGLFHKLHTLHQALDVERSPWVYVWKEINELILPRKSDVGQGNPGVYRERRRYDSTAMNGNERMSASIVGTMTPQTLDWFELAMAALETDRVDPSISMWAQAVATRMHKAIQQSNFASEFEEALLDMGGPGTGALFVDKAPRKRGRFGGLAFQSWSIGEYWISEGANGLVNRIHRKALFTAEQLREKFGDEALHQKVKDCLEQKRYLEKFEIIQCIWEKAEGESLSKKTDKFPIANVFMDVTSKHILEIGGFHEFPVAVGRWRKASGEIYGRGPGMTALPDVQVLNEADRLGIGAVKPT